MVIFDEKTSKSLSWWIASLATGVLISTAFTGYMFDIKADLSNSRTREDILEQRVDMLTSQLENLRRHVVVEQIQISPPDGTIQIPTTVTPSPGISIQSAPQAAAPSPPPNAAPANPAPAAPVKPQEKIDGHE